MTPIPMKDLKEIKSLNRRLEDVRDDMLEIKIERALIEKEDEMNDELLRTEMNRNVRAKNQLQELGELVKARKNKSDELVRANCSLRKGTLTSVVAFMDDKWKELKVANKSKWNEMAQHLSDEIKAFARSNPIVLENHRWRAQKIESDRAIKQNAETLKNLAVSIRSQREMAKAMFQLTATDIASFILRFRALMGELENPNRVARGKPMRMFAPIRMLRAPADQSVTGKRKSNDRMKPASMCQGDLDADEDLQAMDEDRAQEISKGPNVLDPVPSPSTQDIAGTFDRSSFSRSVIRKKKSVVNTVQRDETENALRSKALKDTPTVQSVATPNARDRSNQNGVAGSKEPKRTLPNPAEFKEPFENRSSSQKSQNPKKPKVTFAKMESSVIVCKADFSIDEGVSSSDFQAVSLEDASDENSSDLEHRISFDDNGISPNNENGSDANFEMDVEVGEFGDDLDYQNLDDNRMDAEGQSPCGSFDEADEGNRFTGQVESTQTTASDGFGLDFGNDNGEEFSDFFG